MSMFDFDNLAANLQSNIKLETGNKYEADNRFWRLSKDESGKGVAVIRLIPDKNLVTMVKMFGYSCSKQHPTIPGKKQWLIANSPDSIGLPCPIKEHYLALMAEGTDEAKNEAKNFSRKTKFIANIMVVKDPANKENEGKIFLFEFGVKILDKINAWVKPSQAELDMDQVPMNVWDPINGHNITLKIKKNQFSFDYDDTSIVPTPSSVDKKVVDEETALKFIKAKTYELNEFLQPEYYESYETIKGKLDRYLGTSSTPKPAAKPANKVVEDDLDDIMEDEAPKAKIEPKKTVAKVLEEDDSDDSWLDDLE